MARPDSLPVSTMAASKLQHSPAWLHPGAILHGAEPAIKPSHLCVFLLVWFYRSDPKALKQDPHVPSVKEPGRGSVPPLQFGRDTGLRVLWGRAMGRRTLGKGVD